MVIHLLGVGIAQSDSGVDCRLCVLSLILFYFNVSNMTIFGKGPDPDSQVIIIKLWENLQIIPKIANSPITMKQQSKIY